MALCTFSDVESRIAFRLDRGVLGGKSNESYEAGTREMPSESLSYAEQKSRETGLHLNRLSASCSFVFIDLPE